MVSNYFVYLFIVDIYRIKDLLKKVDSYKSQTASNIINQPIPYFSTDLYPDAEISKTEVIRRRGFFPRYDNITISHFKHPYDFFELHIKSLNSISKGIYNHFIHVIENKELDKVVDHIKLDKSLGDYNFQAGPPWDPVSCLAHKNYDEYTKKEKSRLIESHGKEFVHENENEIKIDYNVLLDDDNIEMIKNFDGLGNVTIRLCRWYEKFDDIIKSGRFYSFSNRSAEAWDMKEDYLDDRWDDGHSLDTYNAYLEENPNDRFVSGEIGIIPNLLGMATKKEILNFTEERQRVMVGSILPIGEIFSITFNSKGDAICMAIEGTGYVFIGVYRDKFLIRETTNYVQEARFANSIPINRDHDFKQNLIDANNLCRDLGWL